MHYGQLKAYGKGAQPVVIKVNKPGLSVHLRERPSENHAELSTDHLSDSLHIWHTYAP